MEPIASRANPRLKAARRLQSKRHRLREGLFLAEGEDIVEEGLAAAILPVESFVAADRAPAPGLVERMARGGAVHIVADDLMADLGTLGHPARVIAVFRHADLPRRPADGDLGVYLHRVIDPGNVGTIVRAAGALGPAWVALSRGCSDPLSGKGVRGSMGAVFRVPIEAVEAPPEGIRRVGLAADSETPVWEVDLTRPTLLVIGAERHGLPEELRASCEVICAVPQAAGAESLNAAQATTVALYEAVRQRTLQRHSAAAIHTESGESAVSARRSNQP